jgi:hypothetical protein
MPIKVRHKIFITGAATDGNSSLEVKLDSFTRALAITRFLGAGTANFQLSPDGGTTWCDLYAPDGTAIPGTVSNSSRAYQIDPIGRLARVNVTSVLTGLDSSEFDASRNIA